jgi:hypothetical protein
MRRIPKALLPAFQKDGKLPEFIKIVLGTKDPMEARKIVRRISAEVEERFDQAERQMRDGATASTASVTLSRQPRARSARAGS